MKLTRRHFVKLAAVVAIGPVPLPAAARLRELVPASYRGRRFFIEPQRERELFLPGAWGTAGATPLADIEAVVRDLRQVEKWPA